MSETPSLRHQYDQLTRAIEADGFEQSSIAWTPRVRPDFATHLAAGTNPEQVTTLLAAMEAQYNLHGDAATEYIRARQLLIENHAEVQAQQAAIIEALKTKGQANIPLSGSSAVNRMVAAWAINEGGMFTLGRHSGNQAAVFPAVLLPERSPLPGALRIGFAGIVEPETNMTGVRKTLNPSAPEYRPTDADLYMGAMVSHFEASYASHNAGAPEGISEPTHLNSALAFAHQGTRDRVAQIPFEINGVAVRSMHVGHARETQFFTELAAGGGIWTDVSMLELGLQGEQPILLSKHPQTGQMQELADRAEAQYFMMIQRAHIDPTALEQGRIGLLRPSVTSIQGFDATAAMLYAGQVMQLGGKVDAAQSSVRGVIDDLRTAEARQPYN